MTREELKMIKEKFNNSRNERIFATLNCFIKHNGHISDATLAEELCSNGIKTTRSTVERDLNTKLKEFFIEENKNKFGFDDLTKEQLEIIAFIKQKRLENKLNGRRKGGINSSINNVATKDEKGHFNGSKKRV